MGSLPHERELEVARRAAQEAAALIAGYAGQQQTSWEKAVDQPVTRADLEANEAIVNRIRRAFPEDAIRSEESASPVSHSERLWLIDPLDGTKEFIAGVPEFAVSIALAIGGEPVVGVVLPPLTRECFWAARGAGAWLDERELRVSSCAQLEHAVLLGSRTEDSRGQLEPYRSWFAKLQLLGSAALKLAWIAAGRSDIWLSIAPKNEWDVCAGDLLVREAGGVFCELQGAARLYDQDDPLLAPPLAAASPVLMAQLRERCSQ